MGDITGILNTKRGRILGMGVEEGMQVITAEVPQVETFKFCSELRSITGGRGTFTATLAQYEEVPAHVAQKVIEEHQAEQEQR